jgi:putative transposase
MRQNTLPAPSGAEQASAIVYGQIEDFARLSIQKLLQQVLEEEVESLLGRVRSERRDPGSPPGYRNGYGKERRLSTSVGTVALRRPRVRNTEEPFLRRVLPLFR